MARKGFFEDGETPMGAVDGASVLCERVDVVYFARAEPGDERMLTGSGRVDFNTYVRL